MRLFPTPYANTAAIHGIAESLVLGFELKPFP